MRSVRLAAALLMAALFAAPAGAAISLWKYNLTDVSASALYPEGGHEYHCLYTAPGASAPSFVAGTYGKFGYFEGWVMPVNSSSAAFTANINWWETNPTPKSGAAALVYSKDVKNVTGKFWNSGNSEMLGSLYDWGSIQGLKINATNEMIQSACLLGDGGAAIGKSHAGLPSLAKAFFGDAGHNIQTCMAGNNLDGEYAYTYTDAAEAAGAGYAVGFKEIGTYEEAQPFNSTVGEGFTATWMAGKKSGPGLYIVAPGKAGAQLLGFYCNTNAAGERTDCFDEVYDLNKTLAVTVCAAGSDGHTTHPPCPGGTMASAAAALRPTALALFLALASILAVLRR